MKEGKSLQNSDNEAGMAERKILFSKAIMFLSCTFPVFTALISISGVSLASSVALCLALLFQWVPGAILWSWVNKGRLNSIAELIGMGLAIGTLLAIFTSQIFRTTSYRRFGWAIPFLISLFLILFLILVKKKTIYVTDSQFSFRKATYAIFPITFLCLLQLWVWWRWHPIIWKGWWKYNIDVPYWESYSNSIAILGTTHNLMNPDLDSRYHWFAYAWIGSLSNSLNIDAFIVLTRVMPIIVFCMASAISYAWAKDYSKTFWTPILAATILILGPGFSLGSYITLRSPSLAMATCWCLAFSLLLMRIIEKEKVSYGAYVILALLASGVVGGKGTNLLIVGAGVIALIFTSFVSRNTARVRTLISGVVSLFIFITTYQKFISSPAPRGLNFGMYFGWPGLFLTILPTIVGIFWLYNSQISKFQPLFVYSVTLISVGSFLSLITYNPTGNQLVFMISASATCLVPSLIGFERAILDKGRSIFFNSVGANLRQIGIFVPFLVILVGLASSIFWTNMENSVTSFSKVGRTSGPILMFLFCLIIFAVAQRVFETKIVQSIGRVKIFWILLLSTSLVASCSGVLITTLKGPMYSDSSGIVGFGASTKENPGSISYNYVKAGRWVQKNIQSTNLFFTNRQCVDPKSSYTDCNSYWFYASALSKQRFLIEGAALTNFTGKETLKMTTEQAVSYRFSLTPNQDDLKTLWASNVRWGWIDRQVSDISDWEGLANEIYSNPDVAIIELANPKN